MSRLAIRLNRLANEALRPFGLMLLSAPGNFFSAIVARPRFTARQLAELDREPERRA